ncbi:cation:proton antiporter regulatory subunit [Halococcoides cellulosivorans]|uniref:Potassium transporter TrkA n=1 Tax=Halococcoides cellulosivorans TaxID=1679096 RepID=A0A2R4WY31_9EURY|nr:TrkA C-terminal domain-containing protein [Halococcoides cellulosivorans]AWB26444.1 potassium transporter TrkA [Halococcoides cellulosivorans]
MAVYETEVPGVGHKFELDLDRDRRVIVLIHHDGTRELYLRPDADSDSEKLFSLDDQRARQLGSILEGAHFQPIEAGDVEVPLGDGLIEWTEITADSPLVGQTLATTDIRERTGASVIAIQRDEQSIPNPGPETTVEAGDLLVTLGTRDEQHAVDEITDSN